MSYKIWKNTLFFYTKLSKVKFIQMLQRWMFEASRKQISRNLDLPVKTISGVLQKLRKALVGNYLDNNKIPGGNNEIVVIDQSKFVKRKYHKGHYVEGVWVLGLVKRSGQKRIKLIILND